MWIRCLLQVQGVAVGVPPLESGGCAFEPPSGLLCARCWSLGFGVLVGDAPLAVVCAAPCSGDMCVGLIVAHGNKSSGCNASGMELPIPSDQRRS